MVKLVSKRTLPFKGKVYDLTVENSHTYNIEGISVHNSGGGSLVNYLLGITQLDPIPYDLLWSRFLGRHKASWPDIDTDAGNRDELINAAIDLYGEDAVIPVSNFNTLKLKSLVKDISKFHGIPYDQVNKITANLQEQVMSLARDENQEKSLYVLTHDDCMKYSPEYREFMEENPQVESHINKLFLQTRSIGRHAGGVIIADPKDLQENMPVIGVRGELQTPWVEGLNYRSLEENGFLKFDFLGLTLLRDVENCIYRILKKQGIKSPTFSQAKDYFDKYLNCRHVKQDDSKVWEHVYHDGRFCGIFQFANEGARNFSIEAKPDNIEELAAVTAIYRPGPLKANVHKKYVEAKRNRDKIKFDHPIIEEILGPTFGYITFQEQFMLLAQKMAGFSAGDSDKLRKTLVKNSVNTMDAKITERAQAKEKFIKGSKEVNDIPQSVSEKIWGEIEFFAMYGFNKSISHDTLIDTYDKNGKFIKTKEISNIVPGVYVKSRDDDKNKDIFTKVVSNHDHGNVPVFKIKLDDNSEIECTMHHKFKTECNRMLPLWFILQEDLSIVSCK